MLKTEIRLHYYYLLLTAFSTIIQFQTCVLLCLPLSTAAGTIHSDFEKGFIKAETINWKDFLDCDCDESKAKRKNLLRTEGKEYITQDGDVYHFKFKA